jgi:hypothetical protein
MSEKKPRPLLRGGVQTLCPVCGRVSYSRGGVHPQCSMRRADEQRMIAIRAQDPNLAKNKPK